MSKSKIEWTEETWNPVTGCDRTSPGCDNCYALTMAKRLKAMGNPRYQNDGGALSGPGFGLTLHPDKIAEPLKWRKPRTVFVNSMSDLFHPDVPYSFVVDVFASMAIAQQHTFQVLTKRPKRLASIVGDIDGAPVGMTARWDFEQAVTVAAEAMHGGAIMDRYPDWQMPEWPLSNVWLGTSIESDRYTFRADHLRATPAAVRFLSLEPLLGPLPSLDLTGIGWVIVGGESGAGARPMHPDWVRDIRDRCTEGVMCPSCLGEHAGATGPSLCTRCEGKGRVSVPFFYKQWGNWRPLNQTGQPASDWKGHAAVALERDGTSTRLELPKMDRAVDVTARVMVRERSKHFAGYDVLDGETWKQMPMRGAEQ